MSAVTAIFHIVINTHNREMTLPLVASEPLYHYMAGVIVNKKCRCFIINGIENHIHMLVALHPSICISDLVRDIKLSSNQWIKQNIELFPAFKGWGKEYGAFSYANRDREMVEGYIARQREHHRRETFEEEYRKHIERAGLEWSDYRLS